MIHIGSGVLAAIFFLALWLGLGHFWIGLAGAVIILVAGSGISVYTGGSNPWRRGRPKNRS